MKKITSVLLLSFILPILQIFCSCADNRPIDRYFLQISYQNGVVEGSLSYSFEVESDDNVLFNLYPNQMNNGSLLTIKRVCLNEGECDFEVIENGAYLVIDLFGKVKAGDGASLTIDFVTEIASSYSRLGKNDLTVNLAYFYPVACVYNGGYVKQPYSAFGDCFYNDFCDMEVELTIPSIMSVACGFQPLEIAVMGEKTTYRYEMNQTKSFTCTLSDVYNIVSKREGGAHVNYFYYNDNSPEERLQEIIDCLDFLSGKIGEYPYSVLTVAQSPYESAGMEYSGFCVIGECEREDDYNYAIIHEVCHQYFPICFLLNEYESGYLDEGLTEFLAQSYLESKKSGVKRAHAQYCESLISAYARAQSTLGKSYDGVMKKALNSFLSKDEYIVTAYYKGYLLFCLIEKQCGDIFPYLKKAFNNYAFKKLAEDELASCFGVHQKAVKKIFDENVLNGRIITLD